MSHYVKPAICERCLSIGRHSAICSCGGKTHLTESEIGLQLKLSKMRKHRAGKPMSGGRAKW